MAEEGTQWDRPPVSLNELLKLSLKLSENEMKEYKSDFTEMDPERRKFLDDAMKSVMENTETKMLIEFVEAMRKRAKDITSLKLEDNELEELSNQFEDSALIMDHIDHAKDFVKMGGMPLAVEFLKCPYSSLQWRSAEVIAVSTQNNPFVQAAALTTPAIPTLMHILDTTDVDIVAVKCLHALSQIVGNYKPGETLFLKLGGLQTIVNRLWSPVLKLKLKAAFMIRKLIGANENDSVIPSLVKARLHVVLIQTLKQNVDDVHDTLLWILFTMASESKEVVLECRRPDYGFKRLISDRRETLDRETYEEALETYGSLYELCFSN